jgi:hypothetical protein
LCDDQIAGWRPVIPEVNLVVPEKYTYYIELMKLYIDHYIPYNIIMDFIKALPGNSFLNTVQHAKIEEAVFSVSLVTSQQWVVIT